MNIPFHTDLLKFLESKLSNVWIYHPDISIYVRKGFHTLPPFRAVRNTLDVANISVLEARQKQGIFTEWLGVAEAMAAEHGFDAVYVESVLNPHLASFLTKRGYTKMGPASCPSFFQYCQISGTESSGSAPSAAHPES